MNDGIISPHTLEMIITVVIAVIGSSGFWAYMQKKNDYKDSRSKMILGLGHDRIVFLCEKYISRGWITNEEYENLYEYLFIPYKDLHGNGSAERLMEEVKKLPTRPDKGGNQNVESNNKL